MKFELDTLLENEIIDYNKIVKVVCNGTPIWKGYTDDLSSLSEDYEFVRFIKDIPNEFNKPDYIIEVAEIGEEEDVDTTPRSPEIYLDTKEQVERVARNFSKISPEHRDIVAKRLLIQAQKLGVNFGDDVDPEFVKYVQETSAESKKIEEALFFELTDGCTLTENMKLSEKLRWKIIKNSMKFVKPAKIREMFPNLANYDDDEIVYCLKQKLDNLPEEKKRELLNLTAAKNLEHAAQFKDDHVSPDKVGKIVGAAGTAAGAPAALVGSIMLPFVPIVGIIYVAGAALNALLSVVIGKGVRSIMQKHHAKSDYMRSAVMSQSEIINKLKEKPKALTEGEDMMFDDAGRPIPGYHKCAYCGANLDASDGKYCDNECRDADIKKKNKERIFNKDDSANTDLSESFLKRKNKK